MQLPDPNYEPSPEIESVRELIEATAYWHGTGRYQYDDSGEIVDVLEGIAAHGGFTPRQDDWEMSRQMVSTSFARDRDYGRLYADMHSPSPMSLERTTPQSELVRKYTRGVARQAVSAYFRENGLRATIDKARDARQKLVLNGRWSRKVNSNAPPITKIFTMGSDISDNYPILFGIKDLPQTEEIASYLARFEVRTTEPVLLDECTHVEVPQERVEEVTALLRSQNISLPVVAIEDAEKLAK